MKKVLTILLAFCSLCVARGQVVLDIIRESPGYASCNYDVYPDSIHDKRIFS